MDMVIAKRPHYTSPHTPKTSLTFLSLPVLFLFAHAAGMIGLRMDVFGLWQPQAHSGMWVQETEIESV